MIDDDDFKTLANLQDNLRELSHNQEAMSVIRSFAESLGKTKHRQRVLNKKGALVQIPIEYQDALNRGVISSEEDEFSLLQGDIISTEAAYLMGERLTGHQNKFAIASSTCDLVPGRRHYAALLCVKPVTKNVSKYKEILGNLLKFNSTKQMYLPPLSMDSEEVLFNVVDFDGLVQIKLENLLLATRHASLSLVGWRLFGSLLRNIMVRSTEGEEKMREIFWNLGN
jgi:hypothetical protein